MALLYQFKMDDETPRFSMDDSYVGLKSFDFVFMFNKSTGSPKAFYFMVDPWMKNRLFPRCNTINFTKLKNLVHFRPVVLDDCLYIIGGKDWETGQHTPETWRYDPATAHWSVRANMKVPRCRHTADVINGCIYITGGEIHGNKVTDQCECYDPVKDKWKTIASLPRPRADHATCVNSGNLYLSGGISNVKHQCSNVFWMYDPVTNQWTDPITGILMPHEREKHNMVAAGKKIFVLGGRGFDQETFSEKEEAAVCSYRIKPRAHFRPEECWDIHANVLFPRANGGAILLGQNIYQLGGKSYSKDCDVLSVESFNTRKRKSREMFQLPDSYSYVNVDCVLLKVPVTNKDINFNDTLLFDKWIMW